MSWTLLATEVRQGSGKQHCVEKKFKLDTRQYEEYKGVRFGNGDCALLVDVWLHQVDEDASGLNFEEWDPSEDTDTSEAPVAMFVKFARGARRRFRPQRSDTSATRDDGA